MYSQGSKVITVEERLFRVFAEQAENTLRSLSSTVMTGHYFELYFQNS